MRLCIFLSFQLLLFLLTALSSCILKSVPYDSFRSSISSINSRGICCYAASASTENMSYTPLKCYMYLKNDVGSWITKNINVVVAANAAAALMHETMKLLTLSFSDYKIGQRIFMINV